MCPHIVREVLPAIIEKISAWMDGELNIEQARLLPEQIKRDAGLRLAWDYYHLIGDTLRGEHGSDLCSRIRNKLDADPIVFAPVAPWVIL